MVMGTTMTTNLQIALDWAAEGIEVLPVCGPTEEHTCGCPGRAIEHTGKEIGKAPWTPHGVADATTDFKRIREWWTAYPTANVAISLSSKPIFAVDCDSTDAEVEAVAQGLPPAPRRVSGHGNAYLYRRPADCPLYRPTRQGTSKRIDLLTAGYLVVYGTHQSGADIYCEPLEMPEHDAPEWAVELLTTIAKRDPQGTDPVWEDDGPPVPLSGQALRRWHGELPQDDRSDYLFFIGMDLAAAGMTPSGIAEAVAERDRTLGFHKYSERRDGGKSQYRAIARKVTAYQKERERDPKLRFGSTAADNPADELTPFPVDALPPTLRTYVEECAAALGVPPGMVGVPLLVATGAALGNAAELEVKRGWRERPNLYAAIVAPPGSKKTPAIAKANRPLHRIQARLAQQYENEAAVYKREQAAWESTPKAQRGPAPSQPAYRHVLTSDATTEALAPMLRDNKSILIEKDELTSWIRGMDQYRSGKGADRQHFLSMWSGSPIKVDRKGGLPIMVQRPCLAVVGGVQPDLLSELSDAASREDGFPDRLLWNFEPVLPDQWTVAEPSLETLGAVETLFERLHNVPCDEGERGEAQPTVFTFGAEAMRLWVAWYDQTAQERQSETFPPVLRGPWAKLPSQAARLALILHVCEPGWYMEVSAATLGAAITLTEYFKIQAQRVYLKMEGQRMSLSLRVLSILKEQGEINLRNLYSALSGNVSADKMHSALEELRALGLADERKVESGRGRPATFWFAR